MAAIAVLKWRPRDHEAARKLHSILTTAPETPDAHILGMEFLLRWGRDQDRSIQPAMLDYLRTIWWLEMPHFSESVGYLWSHLQRLERSDTQLRELAQEFKARLTPIIETLTPDNLLSGLFDETNTMDLVNLMRFGRANSARSGTGSGSSGSPYTVTQRPQNRGGAPYAGAAGV
jgi:hypothetical protein